MLQIFDSNLVSIIIPCYNGAAYVGRILSCLCKQTYKKLQLIFVNDGSIDKTEQIFMSYVGEFQKEGICYNYIYQENKGLAASINTGLQYVNGEYLMWIDDDDFITDDHIERKVRCLKDHMECALVRCQGAVVDESDTNLVKGYLGRSNSVGSLFEDMLLELCDGYTGGLFMVKSKELFEQLPERKIYPSRTGQSFQLLLPMAYSYKTCYIKETLFYYVERKGSMSHAFGSITDWHIQRDKIDDIKEKVLFSMQDKFTEEYKSFLDDQLDILKVHQRIDKVIAYEYIEAEDTYIREVIMSFFQCFRNSKMTIKYRIWGFCEKNLRLAEYLEKYAGINIEGFIDSDVIKQREEQVIAPQEIDVSKMYIIVPLDYHQSIVKGLFSYGFVNRVNFIYLKYELMENLKSRKLANKKDV